MAGYSDLICEFWSNLFETPRKQKSIALNIDQTQSFHWKCFDVYEQIYNIQKGFTISLHGAELIPGAELACRGTRHKKCKWRKTPKQSL